MVKFFTYFTCCDSEGYHLEVNDCWTGGIMAVCSTWSCWRLAYNKVPRDLQRADGSVFFRIALAILQRSVCAAPLQVEPSWTHILLFRVKVFVKAWILFLGSGLTALLFDFHVAAWNGPFLRRRCPKSKLMHALSCLFVCMYLLLLVFFPLVWR